MVNLLSLGRGLAIHACGVIDQGKGLVFAGTSGAGKSTLANLWEDKKKTSSKGGITILSDDRLILRKVKNRFWVYGTPWHGDAHISSPEKALLNKIFFLKQTPENYVRKLKKMDAVSRLLVTTFPTFYSSEGMGYTLAFCGDLINEISCYELGFVPDQRVIDLIENEI